MKALALILAAFALTGCQTVRDGTYVAGGVSRQVAGGVHYIVNDRDYKDALQGQLEVGIAKALGRRVTGKVGIAHESIPELPTDRGQERIFVEIEWRPFRRTP
jgi:hypothetical protein